MLLVSVLFVTTTASAIEICSEVAGEKISSNHKPIWKADVNSDGEEDVFLQSDFCFEGDCQAGLFVSCGNGRYVEVLDKDFKQSKLVVTEDRSPLNPKWKILKAPQSLSGESIQLVDGDKLHDLSDNLSRSRSYQDLMVEKAYKQLRITSPDDFSGQYIFSGAKYEKFRTENEIHRLIRLAQIGDAQAARALYFEIYRTKSELPLYQKYKPIIGEIKNLRVLFAAGLLMNFQDFPAEHEADLELRRYYARANLPNMSQATITKWAKEDASLLREVVKYSAENIGLLPEDLRKNIALTETALAEHRAAINFVDSSFYDNKEKVMAWCERFKISARHISQRLKSDRQVAEACVTARSINYEFFDKYKGDRKIAKSALSRDGYMLAFAPDSIKQDLELVKMALSNYPAGKKYLSPGVKSQLGID